MKRKPLTPLEVVKLCCRALDEKKAADVRVLDVSEQSSITDYLVVATGTSDPHLRALRVELEKIIDASGTRILGMETVQDSGWFVVDLFEVMIHLFASEVRERYGLENLWKDAVEISVPQLLAPSAKPAKTRRLATRKPAKRAVKKRSKP